MITVEKDGYVIAIKKETGEPHEHVIERGYFVVSQQPETQEEYEEAVRFSRIYINKKYKQCKYDEEIENAVTEMSSRMFKQ